MSSSNLKISSALSKRFISSLMIISQEIVKLRVRWVIVGSTSLALQGVPVRPGDLDILTTKLGAYAINCQLKGYETKRVRFRKSPLFQSYFGEFKVSSVKVQVMGDLRVKIANRWVRRTPRLKNPRIIRLRGYPFPVIPLRKQLESYKALSRRKSKAKIEKIERFLTATKNPANNHFAS